jgi:pyruvate dehydrogenase (quinone)/pyruvate oxidase
MPPKVKAQQALHMAEALARGEPNAARVGLTLFRDKVNDIFRGREGREGPVRARRT